MVKLVLSERDRVYVSAAIMSITTALDFLEHMEIPGIYMVEIPGTLVEMNDKLKEMLEE